MKDKVNKWLTAIESTIRTRGNFALLGWIAVFLAITSGFFGARWAFVSCALSLGVLAHTSMAILGSLGLFAESLNRIAETNDRETRAGVVKQQSQQPSVSSSEPTKVN